MQFPRPRRARSVATKKTTRAFAQAIEAMESRRMMAVSLDAAGWTKITPSSDTKTVYVSSSTGSDGNDGLSESSPIRSIATGVSMLRSGSPDWLVLKRGDVFTDAIPDWTKSGRNSDEPLVISTYGDADAARPWLKTGTKRGFYSHTAFHDVAMIGLKFSAQTRDPGSSEYAGTAGAYGLQTVGPIDGLLVEDTSFDHYVYNASIQGFKGYAKNIQIRRSQFLDSYDIGVKSVGFYSSQTEGTLFEGNLFDHNGWNEEIAGAEANIYSHNLYLWQTNRDPVIRGNIFVNAGSHGVQARGGGTIENNLFLRNPIGALLGNGSEVTPGGVTGRITGNVFLEDRDTNGALRGWAIEVGNLKDGGDTIISDNIITQDSQNRFAAIKLETATGAKNATTGVGINDLTITRNIVYKWYQALGIASGYKFGGGGMTGLNDIVVSDNDFQQTTSAKFIHQPQAINLAEEDWNNNRYYNTSSDKSWFHVGGATTSFDAWKQKMEPTAQKQEMEYADPERTVGSYNGSLGGSSTEAAFLEAVRGQDKAGWNADYATDSVVSYIRAGFTGSTPSDNDPPVEPKPVNESPTATLASAADRTAAGTGSHTVKITFSDDKGVDVSTIGTGDVRVIGPNGYSEAATFVSVDKTTNGTPRTATFSVAAPGGSWDHLDNGGYSIALSPDSVYDTDGASAPATALGSFQVNVATPTGEDAPPQVLWSNFDVQDQTITMRFSEDVSKSLNTSDLRLKNLKTLALIPFGIMRMSYDKQTNTATWWFTEEVPAADYKIILISPVVTDAAGNMLDGDGNGVWNRNDDYSFIVRGADMTAAALLARGVDVMAPVLP